MSLPQRHRARAAAVLGVLASLSAAAGEEGLLRSGFEESAGEFREAWRRKGEAEFALDEAELCYYRVYRSGRAGSETGPQTRIGSTAATEFVDASAEPGARLHYAVTAVDTSGNAGAPARYYEAASSCRRRLSTSQRLR
ncbi:MAG: hypothetical protein ACYS9X_03360 [Planctomycetota bacterium]|jgi:hypothetical protein